MVWGLVWIAVGRASDAPHSPAVAIGAAAAAAVIGVAALLALRRPSARTPSALHASTQNPSALRSSAQNPSAQNASAARPVGRDRRPGGQR